MPRNAMKRIPAKPFLPYPDGREMQLAKKPELLKNCKLPLRPLPVHILLGILQKMKFLAWIRLRRTSNFIENFVCHNINGFAIECDCTKLQIKYVSETQKIKFLLGQEGPFVDDEWESERDISILASSLSGLHFEEISLDWNKLDTFPENRWPMLEKLLCRKLKNVTLGCDTLVTPFGLEKVPKLVEFFRSVDKIKHKAWAPSYSTNQALDVFNTPQLKDTYGVTFKNDGDCDHLIPLMHRADYLSMWTESPHDRRTVSLDIGKIVQEVLKGNAVGSFNGQRKVIDLVYFTEIVKIYANETWLSFPELENVKVRKIWEEKSIHLNNHGQKEGDHRCFFFIEGPQSFAACLLKAYTVFDPFPLIKFHMNLEPAFDPEQIITLLDELVPRFVNRSELFKAIDERDWKAFEKALTKIWQS